MSALITLDSECYANNLQADQRRISELEHENRDLQAEVDRLNQALDRALPPAKETKSEEPKPDTSATVHIGELK